LRVTPQIAADLAADFETRLKRKPLLFRAPGRVNLIGEHTDYNDGFVLPAAIELATYVAAAPRADRKLRVESRAFGDGAEMDLDAPPSGPRGHWSDYVFGVAIELLRAKTPLVGADLSIDGDLPIGAGLSTSAALEVSVGLALTTLAGAPVAPVDLALIGARAENGFVGMRCGVMDQFASACGREGAALLLDCRSLEAKPVAVDPRLRLLVCESGVRHELASGEYNARRRDCEAAVAALARALPGSEALRDVSAAQLAGHAALLSPELLRRARHVVSENARTLRFAEAMAKGDLADCGALLYASHASLRDDYEVSCHELDALVDIARGVPGVVGARMMGGGFGGSTINLVRADAVEPAKQALAEGYRKVVGRTPEIFVCSPSAGASRIAL
jgi:galactokinase